MVLCNEVNLLHMAFDSVCGLMLSPFPTLSHFRPWTVLSIPLLILFSIPIVFSAPSVHLCSSKAPHLSRFNLISLSGWLFHLEGVTLHPISKLSCCYIWTLLQLYLYCSHPCNAWLSSPFWADGDDQNSVSLPPTMVLDTWKVLTDTYFIELTVQQLLREKIWGTKHVPVWWWHREDVFLPFHILHIACLPPPLPLETHWTLYVIGVTFLGWRHLSPTRSSSAK